MPTNNPIPSSDPSDLLFNAQKLDETVNSASLTFTDRLGAPRKTMAGIQAAFDAQLADAESDLNVYRADAAASAAEALGYLQTYRATSYGALASDPATDPLGNPPTVGDEYFNTTSNLLKRFNGTTWQASDINTANLAAASGSSLVGFKPAGAGAVSTTVEKKLQEIVSVTDKGAKGDWNGSTGTDDSAAFVLAGDNFIVPSTGSYRIGTSVSVGRMICLGGSIQVDAGVTLTVQEIVAPDSMIIFTGAGTVKCKTNKYSVGWFSGMGLNEKWEFSQRGHADSEAKYVLIPYPNLDDPAMTLDYNNHPAWGLTGPMYFNSKNNVMTMDIRAHIVPKNVMSGAMVIFGNIDKPEDIKFTNGIYLNGSRKAQSCMQIVVAARLDFQGWSQLRDSTGDMLVWNAGDHNTFEYLSLTGYGGIGMSVTGSGATAFVGNEIQQLFTNGSGYAIAGVTQYAGTNLVKITGAARGLKIGSIVEAISTNYYAPITDCYIRIVANSTYNASIFGASIGDFVSFNTTATSKPVLITEKTTGTNQVSVEIGEIRSSYEAAGLVQLNFAKNCKIGKIHRFTAANSIVKFIAIGAECSNIDIGENDSTLVSGYCDWLTQGSAVILPEVAIPTDSVISITLPSHGSCPVTVIGTGSNIWASFIARLGSAVLDVAVGSLVDVTTGVLTGTTGAAGRVTISVAVVSDFNRRLYIENRVASAQTVSAMF